MLLILHKTEKMALIPLPGGLQSQLYSWYGEEFHLSIEIKTESCSECQKEFSLLLMGYFCCCLMLGT